MRKQVANSIWRQKLNYAAHWLMTGNTQQFMFSLNPTSLRCAVVKMPEKSPVLCRLSLAHKESGD